MITVCELLFSYYPVLERKRLRCVSKAFSFAFKNSLDIITPTQEQQTTIHHLYRELMNGNTNIKANGPWIQSGHGRSITLILLLKHISVTKAHLRCSSVDREKWSSIAFSKGISLTFSPYIHFILEFEFRGLNFQIFDSNKTTKSTQTLNIQKFGSLNPNFAFVFLAKPNKNMQHKDLNSVETLIFKNLERFTREEYESILNMIVRGSNIHNEINIIYLGDLTLSSKALLYGCKHKPLNRYFAKYYKDEWTKEQYIAAYHGNFNMSSLFEDLTYKQKMNLFHH